MSKPAFEVDKKGLEKILARRGKEFAVLELIQNALDEDVCEVDVTIEPVEGSRGYHRLVVRDDSPEGFADLAHAYTLFAESKKKVNPEQRGRFNLGEKLVLACCRWARIETTTGTITWDGDKRRHSSGKTSKGSIFTGEIRMTKDEAARSVTAVRRVLFTDTVDLRVNGEYVEERHPVTIFETTLPTEISDEEGFLRKTQRKTPVLVYEPKEGEVPTLYEMGIPVVEIDGQYHVDIQQKVPLNSDRDNVTPSYLRKVRAQVLNHTWDTLDTEKAKGAWVNDALESNEVNEEAVDAVLTARYGEKRVLRDPSDPESTKRAVSQGYSVVEPGTFNRTQWSTIKSAGGRGVLPSGQITPSAKPYSDDGDILKTVPRKEWTPGMERFERVAKKLAKKLMDVSIRVEIAREVTWPYGATYGNRRLVVNLGRVGHRFFDEEIGERQVSLLIHEFGHEYSGDHLSSEYHDALCRLGATLAFLEKEDWYE